MHTIPYHRQSATVYSSMAYEILNNQYVEKSSTFLLIIAHPDDEVMFFSPLLNAIEKQNSTVHILCLSNGNDEGLGDVRSEELTDCGMVFNIPEEHIHIVNHAAMQDGMRNTWPVSTVANAVLEWIDVIKPDIIVTFDERGVSNHPNHIATYKGVLQAHATSVAAKKGILGLKLESRSIWRKFLGPLDILLSMFSWDYSAVSFDLMKTIRGMQAHASQNKIYRQAFVIFSSFTYLNNFKELV